MNDVALLIKNMSLSQLEEYDSEYTMNGNEYRFMCPIPGICDGKIDDASHRSLAVNKSSGAWICHRCGAKGLLREYWSKEPTIPRKSKGALLKNTKKVTLADEEMLDHQLNSMQSVTDSPAEEYLIGRGIPLHIIGQSDVYYSDSWGCNNYHQGHESVVFLLTDNHGEIVAAAGRSIVSEMKSAFGNKKQGVFITSEAFDSDIVIIVEGPIDALSICACGYPAIALAGCTWPDWLPKKLAFKKVVIGTDADQAGQDAAKRLAKALSPYTKDIWRIKPPGHQKDWNDALICYGLDRLEILLTESLIDIIWCE